MNIDMQAEYIQDPSSQVVGGVNKIFIRSAMGRLIVCDTNVDLLTALLSNLRAPTTIEVLAKRTHRGTGAIAAGLSFLINAGCAVLCNAPSTSVITRSSSRIAVVGICGSIQAAAMLPLVLSVRDGLDLAVHVILTRSARQFVAPAAYTNFGIPVWFEDGTSSNSTLPAAHIALAEMSSVCLVAPATAHFVARMASGSCSDFLSLVALCHKAPVIIAPCMNPAMLNYVAVKRNIDQLRGDGLYIVEPRLGRSAHAGASASGEMSALGLNETNVAKLIATIIDQHS